MAQTVQDQIVFYAFHSFLVEFKMYAGYILCAVRA